VSDSPSLMLGVAACLGSSPSWRGCNGSAGVQFPGSTQSSSQLVGDVGRHGHGTHGDMYNPVNSECRGVTTPAPVGGSEGSNAGPTGGRQHDCEVMSCDELTQGDDLGGPFARGVGAVVLRGATSADRRIAQACKAAHKGRMGCAFNWRALTVRGTFGTPKDRGAGAHLNSIIGDYRRARNICSGKLSLLDGRPQGRTMQGCADRLSAFGASAP
jgi:hypothetical protein